MVTAEMIAPRAIRSSRLTIFGPFGLLKLSVDAFVFIMKLPALRIGAALGVLAYLMAAACMAEERFEKLAKEVGTRPPADHTHTEVEDGPDIPTVPEPSAFVLLVAGTAAVAWGRYRRGRQRH